MIVMFVEAEKQLLGGNKIITAFRILDTTVSNPINIADQGKRTETQLYARPKQNPFDKNCPSLEVRICVRDNEQWKEVGRGTIQVEYEKQTNAVDNDREIEELMNDFLKKLDEAKAICQATLPKDQFYDFIRGLGLDYGPAFQSLDNITHDKETVSLVEVSTFNWAAYGNKEAVQQHTIHPTTIDAAMHLGWVTLTKGCTRPIPLNSSHKK
jgi:hypothetical protein